MYLGIYIFFLILYYYYAYYSTLYSIKIILLIITSYKMYKLIINIIYLQNFKTNVIVTFKYKWLIYSKYCGKKVLLLLFSTTIKLQV